MRLTWKELADKIAEMPKEQSNMDVVCAIDNEAHAMNNLLVSSRYDDVIGVHAPYLCWELKLESSDERWERKIRGDK